MGAVFAMTVLLQVFALAMPLQMQFTVDQGIRQGDMNIIVALAVGFGTIAVISALTDYYRSLLVLYAGNTAAFRMVGGLAHHLLRLPDAWFTAPPSRGHPVPFQLDYPCAQLPYERRLRDAC